MDAGNTCAIKRHFQSKKKKKSRFFWKFTIYSFKTRGGGGQRQFGEPPKVHKFLQTFFCVFTQTNAAVTEKLLLIATTVIIQFKATHPPFECTMYAQWPLWLSICGRMCSCAVYGDRCATVAVWHWALLSLAMVSRYGSEGRLLLAQTKAHSLLDLNWSASDKKLAGGGGGASLNIV